MNLNNKMIGGLIAGVVMGSLLVYTVPKYIDIDFKNETKQEKSVEQFQFKQQEQVETKSNVEKAYEYIQNNLQIDVTGTSSVELQQTDEGLILVLTYADDVCKAIEENGVTEEALMVDAENIINQIVLPVKQELQNNNIDCPIAVVFQLSNGEIVMITQDDEILEINPIAAPVKEEYVQKEEQTEKKLVINQRC